MLRQEGLLRDQSRYCQRLTGSGTDLTNDRLYLCWTNQVRLASLENF